MGRSRLVSLLAGEIIQAKSYSDSVADAAGNIGLSSNSVHEKLAADIYCGTGMLNAILTGDGKKSVFWLLGALTISQ